MVYTKAFWRGTFERVASTFIQALIAVIGVNAFTPVNMDWGQLFLGAGFAAIVSLLKNLLAGLSNGTPSITNAEVPVDDTLGH